MSLFRRPQSEKDNHAESERISAKVNRCTGTDEEGSRCVRDTNHPGPHLTSHGEKFW